MQQQEIDNNSAKIIFMLERMTRKELLALFLSNRGERLLHSLELIDINHARASVLRRKAQEAYREHEAVRLEAFLECEEWFDRYMKLEDEANEIEFARK